MGRGEFRFGRRVGAERTAERRRKGKGRTRGEKRKQLLDVKATNRAPAVTEKSNLSAIRRI